MKLKSLITTGLTVSLLLAMGYSSFADAHSLTGALGRGAGATDVYRVRCTDGSGAVTSRLATHVRDLAPKAIPHVSALTYRGTKATNTTDRIDGNKGFSPFVNNNAGTGTYIVMVSKNRLGSETYQLEFHCQAANGTHTGTSVTRIQNR